MSRPPRFFAPGVPLHIIHRGNNRGRVFFAPEDRDAFAAVLKQSFESHGIPIHAYVFMDNHIHLLATPPAAEALPRAMKQLGGRYGRLVNRAHGRTGTLWEGRYRACLVDSERYVLACMRYIELNPVRAGIVAAPGEFRWSSYRANVDGVVDRLVTPHDVWNDLGPDQSARQNAYRVLFGAAMTKAGVDEIRAATQYGWPLGGSDFKARIESITGVRAVPHRVRRVASSRALERAAARRDSIV